MADPNPNPDDEGIGDVVDISSDSDDEIFHMAMDEDAGEGTPGPDPPPMPLGPVAAAGPHRAQSVDAVSFAESIFTSSGRAGRRFVQTYRVLSVAYLESRGHQNLESGGKVILPPSALQQLSRNSSVLLSPMLFKATNMVSQKYTHCGVLEFIAEEDICYMPNWMMEYLGTSDHEQIKIERVELPVATFAKFEPQSVDFLEITNPKAILENTLRHFACLTKLDVVSIYYNNRIYKLRVLETLPQDAVCIIQCDMNVDFAPPVGYVSPSSSKNEAGEVETTEDETGFVPFTGNGKRLNGKTMDEDSANAKKLRVDKKAPDFDWKIGILQYKRTHTLKKAEGADGASKFTPFGGEGLSLRRRLTNDLDNPSDT